MGRTHRPALMCRAADCTSDAVARGFCRPHYSKARSGQKILLKGDDTGLPVHPSWINWQETKDAEGRSHFEYAPESENELAAADQQELNDTADSAA